MVPRFRSAIWRCWRGALFAYWIAWQLDCFEIATFLTFTNACREIRGRVRPYGARDLRLRRPLHFPSRPTYWTPEPDEQYYCTKDASHDRACYASCVSAHPCSSSPTQSEKAALVQCLTYCSCEEPIMQAPDGVKRRHAFGDFEAANDAYDIYWGRFYVPAGQTWLIEKFLCGRFVEFRPSRKFGGVHLAIWATMPARRPAPGQRVFQSGPETTSRTTRISRSTATA